MGFKTGKGNVVSQKNEEIQRLKEEIDELKFRPQLEKFAEAMGGSILMFLAMTPYEKWPEIAKEAFKWQQKWTPTTAYFYKEKLPKE